MSSNPDTTSKPVKVKSVIREVRRAEFQLPIGVRHSPPICNGCIFIGRDMDLMFECNNELSDHFGPLGPMPRELDCDKKITRGQLADYYTLRSQ